MEEMDTEIACIRLGNVHVIPITYHGHKAIIKKAYATATKHIDAEVDQRIQMWKDGNKTLEEDILEVLIMLKDTHGNPLMNVKEIKAQLCLNSCWQHWIIPQMQLNGHLEKCEKYFIPKGSVVLLSRLGLGRNPKVWEDSLKFKPERHLKEAEDGGEVVLTDSKLRLLSFSMGRRGCPAVKLGSTITTMSLARLLQGFPWSLPPNSICNDLINKSSNINHFSSLPLVAQAKPRLANAMYT
ncbi:Valine N-monooxygenase 2 [Capsicum baccatum]|uniref:Valine N-monooxygenase 2 n=1 Tax=Capsicum baccatum TaxID=33114 RepID=A0A2G2V1K9_CAPBA|nr:Valine N-monooxygenase 2 [Capsicum baccatum]